MAASSWGELAELELRFARSRRRAAARRREPPRRSGFARPSVRAALLALVLLAVVAESTHVGSSSANLRVRRVSPLTPGPSCPVPARQAGTAV